MRVNNYNFSFHDIDFTCIDTVSNYDDDDDTINENKSNDDVSDEYLFINKY